MSETLINKPPMDYEQLRDVIELSLWTGQLLLQNGAEAQRVEDTVHHLGTGLGANWLDIFISASTIAITTHSGTEFRTKIRRVVNLGVNMTVISAVNNMSRRVTAGEYDRFRVRQELERISKGLQHYNRWLIVAMVGVACGAFSQLLGAGWEIFIITFFSASTAMAVRQELHKRHFNPYLIVSMTAFIGGVLGSSASLLHLPKAELALTASVLLLVPGVPLVNAFEDMLKGYMVIGMARAATGTQILLAIALGLLLAISVTGVKGF